MSRKNRNEFQQQRSPSLQDELDQALNQDPSTEGESAQEQSALAQEPKEEVSGDQGAISETSQDQAETTGRGFTAVLTPVDETGYAKQPATYTGVVQEPAQQNALSPAYLSKVSESAAARVDPTPRNALRSIEETSGPAVEQVPSTPSVILEQKEQNRIMKSVELDLANYMEAVHPSKTVTGEFGAGWQNSLYQTLKRVINNTNPDTFKVEWNTLLNFFHRHQDEMFNENFIFRFGANWKGSAKDFTAFRHLVYLAVRTADPKTRQKEARDFSINRVIQGMPVHAANNLINFYE